MNEAVINKFDKRVAELEEEGLTTSDAQGAAEIEFAQAQALPMLALLKSITIEQANCLNAYQHAALARILAKTGGRA